jgi:hypothetical protein
MTTDLYKPSTAATNVLPSRQNASVLLTDRIDGMVWANLEQQLSAEGFATTPVLLDAGEYKAAVNLYATDKRFRSRIVIERYAK